VVGASNALLDGFVIRGGSGDSGPALRASGNTGLKLRDVRFEDNTSTGCGGAIHVMNGDLSIERGAFVDNSADNGGAICLEQTPTATFVGTQFTGNSAKSGGAIYATSQYGNPPGPTVTLDRCVFRTNLANYLGDDATGRGGAAYFGATTLKVTNCDFAENEGYFSDGLDLDYTSATIVNSVFANHNGIGPVIQASGSSTLNMTNCTLAFNDIGSCMGVCGIAGPGAGLGALRNSVVAMVGRDHSDSTGMTTSGNCYGYRDFGSATQPLPFVSPLTDRDGNGVEDYLLEQPGTNACVNAGSDADANAAGLDWTNLTTSGNNCRDVSPVDAGRHYAPTVASPPACG
jgi:predicted outer membrane repeat protein